MSWVSWRWDSTAWSGRISSHATLIVSCKLSMLQPLSWPSARNLSRKGEFCHLVTETLKCWYCWFCCFNTGVSPLYLSEASTPLILAAMKLVADSRSWAAESKTGWAQRTIGKEDSTLSHPKAVSSTLLTLCSTKPKFQWNQQEPLKMSYQGGFRGMK